MALQTQFHPNIKRLALGTVQFGQDYGIANERGRIAESEIEEILNYAFENEMSVLDTARSYQNSEQVIGNYLFKGNKAFKIVSKLPAFDSYKKGDAQQYLDRSLEDLKQKNIYGYLIHDFESYKQNKDLWMDLVSLKEKGKVSKIGFSLYLPQELDELLKDDTKIDVLQLPYSILDQRFAGYLKELKYKGIEIFIRSVFLQGLVFLKPGSLKGNLVKAEGVLGLLNDISRESDISIGSLCLNYVLNNDLIDHVIVGVDGIDHFKSNIKNLSEADAVRDLSGILDELKINDEEMLLPYKWKVK